MGVALSGRRGGCCGHGRGRGEAGASASGRREVVREMAEMEARAGREMGPYGGHWPDPQDPRGSQPGHPNALKGASWKPRKDSVVGILGTVTSITVDCGHFLSSPRTVFCHTHFSPSQPTVTLTSYTHSLLGHFLSHLLNSCHTYSSTSCHTQL